MARLNKIIVIAGGKGTGKTTISRKIAASQSKPVIVVCTFDHPSYRDLPILNIEDLKKDWRSKIDGYTLNTNDYHKVPKYEKSLGGVRIFSSDPHQIIRDIEKYCSNAFIILEDARLYIDGRVPKDIEVFMINSKQKNFDILIMFHSLSQVPKFVRQMYDDIILMKTKDVPAVFKIFDCAGELLQKFNKLKKSKNPFAIEIIQV